jgi:hypothetical protein
MQRLGWMGQLKPDMVQELGSIWNSNGGFVFQQVHNVLADVPPVARGQLARSDRVDRSPLRPLSLQRTLWISLYIALL